MRRLLLLIALPLWACEKSTSVEGNDIVAVPEPEPATAPAPSPAATSSQLPTPTPSSIASRDEPPAPSAAMAKLAVDGEGLRLVDPVSGRTTPFAFGMPERQLLAILEKTHGSAARSINGECGAGPLGHANWADGLSLLMKDGRFVGWAIDGRSNGGITTMAGIGTGSSRKDLSDAYLARFKKTTLGTEFEAGEIGGLLDGPSGAAKITNMWAGVTCLFR